MAISACSNVTSQHTDLARLNSIIKNYRNNIIKDKGKALLFVVDAVAFVPHHFFDLSNNGFDEIDYACISPHKMLGGSESTGVLVVKRSSYKIDKTPSFPGGGTVMIVVGVE